MQTKTETDPKANGGLKKSSNLVLTPIDIPTFSTNPFLSNKLHQSSSSLFNLTGTGQFD